MCLLHDGFPFVTRKPSHPQWPSSEGPNHKLTSQNPECQKILARLLAGDWMEDRAAMKKFGGVFQYKPRKRYMRKEGQVPKWSWDGLHLRLDARLAGLTRRLGG